MTDPAHPHRSAEDIPPTDIDPRILRLRVELYAAAQLLKGDDLKAFTDLIREIAWTLHLELTPAEIARIAG